VSILLNDDFEFCKQYVNTFYATAEELRQYLYCKRIPIFRRLFKGDFPHTYLQIKGTELHNKEGLKRKKKMNQIKNTHDDIFLNNIDNIKELDDMFNSVKLNDINEDNQLFEFIDEDFLKKFGTEEEYESKPLIKSSDSSMLNKNKIELSIKNKDYDNLNIYFDLYLYSSKLELIGIVDYLIVDFNKKIACPVEIKSGLEPSDKLNDPYKIQLVALAMLVEDNFKLLVNKVRIRYIMYKKTKELNINYEDRTKVLKIIKNIKNYLKDELLPEPNSIPQLCYVCDHFTMCGGV